MHQSLGGESGELPTQKAGNLGLIDMQNAGGARLSKPSRAERGPYAHGQISLGEALLRMG